jgi:hypothetical protein
MTNHIAMLSVHIDFDAKPGEDPAQLADEIARDAADLIRQRFGSSTSFLDDVLDKQEAQPAPEAKPRQMYRVSCIATLLHRVEFEVEAESPRQAIDFCNQRLDDRGNYIEPTHDKFLETEDESGWEAEPMTP